MTDIVSFMGVSSVSSSGSLSSVVEIVQQMAKTHDDITFGQKRCKVIVQRAALIVRDVKGSFKLRNDQINIMRKTFGEIQTILRKLADMSFFKALLHFEVINKEIERANYLLTECSDLFLIDLSPYVEHQSKAAVSDRDALRTLLKIIAGNYQEIRHRFDIESDEQEGQAMVAMERELRNARFSSEEDMPLELQIMRKSLECITATTGKSVPEQKKWLITEYDLVDCGIIARGGFSIVSKARFRGTMVAVKKLKDFGNTREALEREIEIWSNLRHDYVVPFYGASTLASPPYLVSRYMPNGNLIQYLAKTTNADRTKLIFEVSLGMYYLHERGIVHGDLKGVNVLVDDAGYACITDFGLSKVFSPKAVRTGTNKIAGTFPFLAPEALKGQPLSFETDVYAFGILIYEVFTDDIPFSAGRDYMSEQGRVELHRPTSNKVRERGFNDVLWRLLSECISREPWARPRFKVIQELLSSIKELKPSAPSDHPEDAHLTDWGFDPMPTNSASPTPVNKINLAPTTEGPSTQSTLPDTADKCLTNWGLDTKPTITLSPTPTIDTASPLANGKSIGSERSSTTFKMLTPRDVPPSLPTCIEVTHKYFGVKFGVSSREPCVHREEGKTGVRQPIRANPGTFLYEEANTFWYRSGAGEEDNSWELQGNDVILRSVSVKPGICHFNDDRTAQKWFRLQSNYARDGNVDGWESAAGDWIYTELSWRRLVSGQIQQADLVGGMVNEMPSDRSWSNIEMPERCIIDNYAGTKNSLVCTSPGRYPGRFCCKLDGYKIVFETYRKQSDDGPMSIREETYPSEEYAEAAFRVVKTLLGKIAEQSNKPFFRSLWARK